MRQATDASTVDGSAFASMHVWICATRCAFMARTKANRSYSRLMRGTSRSMNISEKYWGCSRPNS